MSRKRRRERECLPQSCKSTLSVTQRFGSIPGVALTRKTKFPGSTCSLAVLHAARDLNHGSDSRIGPARRQGLHHHRRTALHGANHLKVFSLTGRMQGNKVLLNAEGVNQGQLPMTKDLQRQHLEMAKNPDQQQTLGKSWLDIPRTEWSQNPQYSCGKFVHQHVAVPFFLMVCKPSSQWGAIIASGKVFCIGKSTYFSQADAGHLSHLRDGFDDMHRLRCRGQVHGMPHNGLRRAIRIFLFGKRDPNQR